jgi:hypothetical protein
MSRTAAFAPAEILVAALVVAALVVAALVVAALVVACGHGARDANGDAPGGWFRPADDETFVWQLRGALDRSVDADVYDIDLFDTPAATIAALQAEGRSVVCYLSAGSAEDWRADYGRYATADLGRPLDGWEGERWVDVRSARVRAILADRLDLAADKGCDGVEPDNVDGFANDTGFPLTRADQLAFDRWLAVAAHARGLAVGLKNALDLAPELAPDFDFAVGEQCHEFDECAANAPFVAAGKPVWNVEYATDEAAARARAATLCPAAAAAGIHTYVLPLELDGSWRVACDE